MCSVRSPEARQYIEHYLTQIPNKTFYHYYPLIVGISESQDEPFEFTAGSIYVHPDELYLQPLDDIDTFVNKVWVAHSNLPNFISEPYDNNYIYDLDITLNVKNFRMNVKKFLQRNEGRTIEWRDYVPLDDAVDLLKKWYKAYAKPTTDMGYTVWLLANYEKFDDLKLKGLYLDGELSSISMWGKLDTNTAIYIVCKTAIEHQREYFTSDYVRWLSYQDMAKEFKYVNDGSDLGLEGLKQYKQKFRPINIIQINSLNKK